MDSVLDSQLNHVLAITFVGGIICYVSCVGFFSNFAISKIIVVELSNGTSDKFSFISDFDSVDGFFAHSLYFLVFHQQESANTGAHASNSQTWMQLTRK